jgi:hypothetical protein
MFEMTYSTPDGRRVRGGMAFDSPSHARNGVFMSRMEARLPERTGTK